MPEKTKIEKKIVEEFDNNIGDLLWGKNHA
jgi:hypothetical protein